MYKFISDSYSDYKNPIIVERRLFKVRCDALLIDLRGQEKTYPDLVNRSNYTFCQQLGAFLVDQGQNGLLVKSARCEGTNAAIFKQERLSNVIDVCYLKYNIKLDSRVISIERIPGKILFEVDINDIM